MASSCSPHLLPNSEIGILALANFKYVSALGQDILECQFALIYLNIDEKHIYLAYCFRTSETVKFRKVGSRCLVFCFLRWSCQVAPAGLQLTD